MGGNGITVGRGDGLGRRQFIGRASAVAAASVSPFFVMADKAKGANEKIGVGFIGSGGRAGAHMRVVKQLQEAGYPVEPVAVCDTYRPRREAAMQSLGITKSYSDHRALIADMSVDVVCIATPDHIHGYQALDAIAAGKDVYCEKPVTHWRQFALTKKLADAVAKSDRIFQLGTQAMSDPVWRQMKGLVKDGLIGQPVHAEGGFFRTGDWGERGMKVDDAGAKPGEDLNWEAFLGDSPKREFSADRYFRWRLFEDYAGGPVTDLYPHSITQVVDIMGLGFPDRVTGIGSVDRYDFEMREVPDSFQLIAHYPEKVTVVVMGTQANDFTASTKRGAGARTPVLRGWDGALYIDEGNKEIVFMPVREKGAKKPQRIPIEGGENFSEHWRNLLDCVRSRRREDLWSPMELAFRVQTMLQMAMLSHKAGKVAKFDAAKREIII